MQYNDVDGLGDNNEVACSVGKRKRWESSAKKVFASLAISSACFGGAIPAGDWKALAATGSSTALLEEKILQLENAKDRGDIVQGFADLFEAAGSNTLKARTKYKYRLFIGH